MPELNESESEKFELEGLGAAFKKIIEKKLIKEKV